MTVSRRKRQQPAMLTLTPDKLVRLSPDLKPFADLMNAPQR
jgi:hypothetical protein